MILTAGISSEMAVRGARPALQNCARRRFTTRSAAFNHNHTNFRNVEDYITVFSHAYPRDEMTNVTPHLLAKADRKLIHQDCNPLSIIKRRIVNYFNKSYVTSRGTPLFVLVDHLSPVVTLEQNFDSLLIGKDHPMRYVLTLTELSLSPLIKTHPLNV